MAKHIRRSSISKAHSSKHRSSIWAGAISILLLCAIAGIRILGDQLYEFPHANKLEHLPKDVPIVCLAGGKGRIEAALTLYARGVGSELFIIGAGKKSTVSNLLKNKANDINLTDERLTKIQVETESRNTIENSFAVSRALEKARPPSKIILVTSSYHMRRAKFMIENQIHRDIEVILFPPPQDSIEMYNWWHSWIGIQVTVIEYIKFILARILIPRLGYF